MVSGASNLTLRRANPDDAAFLTGLRNTLSPYFLSPVPATVERTLTMLNESQTFIVERDSRPVGTFSFYDVRFGRAEFGRFMVLLEEQGKGIAKWVVEEAIRRACEFGLRRLILTVRRDNKQAIGIYETHDFVVILEEESHILMGRVL